MPPSSDSPLSAWLSGHEAGWKRVQLSPEPAFHHAHTNRCIDSKGTLHNSMPMLSNLADHMGGCPSESALKQVRRSL
jgi:hypothetical protein